MEEYGMDGTEGRRGRRKGGEGVFM